jgi:two-component system chemotaxis sensor kinase CheA
VIAGASAGLRASQIRDEALVATIGEVMRLVEEVRDGALQLRMVPIGTTFSRFQRVVRDVSADLGKDISLVISGGETEVDKALVEQIGDPLMHLVRNSMDHGIEPPDVRASRGKPARGTLRLNAFHDSGSIVIEVGDDGGGIDTSRVLAKAVERGLVEPGASLTDQEICQLIFEPGFSTVDQVSDLSGRGVGMDVVKRNVTALRGTIDIDNRPGQGSTMRIRLPLTLAIIDGFLVGVGGAAFIIPLDQVIECVELPVAARSRDCMDLRGEVLPFIRLRSLFDIAEERQRRENVVVVEYAGMKIGLVVDALMGEFQTVIKPLSRVFEHVQGIGGSTILGNGDVALIIDVPMLVRHYGDRQGAGQLATTGSARD